jgi:aldose sugar dehydrogenase
MRNRYWFIVFLIAGLAACSKTKEASEEKIIGYLNLGHTTLAITEQVAGLEVPWDIDAGVEGTLWYTQQKGTIHRMDLKAGKEIQVFEVPDLIAKKSYGLLGMAVHPKETYVFLHYTFAISGSGQEESISSRLVRYRYRDGGLEDKLILMDSLPGATYHNGSRILISPDDYIYFSLGDVGRTNLTQDPEFAGGKVFRLKLDGTIPEDNPIPNNPVWALGFRNTQGLAMNYMGQLYGTDHGPINDDEVNLIMKGGNYGWPDVQGFCDTEAEKKYCSTNYVNEPLIAYTPTIATGGLAYYGENEVTELQNTLLMASMKGRSIRLLSLDESGQHITKERIFLQQAFGRIRDISVAPSGEIFFSTSNKDWHPRFQPWMYENLPQGPDRIIKIRKLKENEAVIPGLPVYQEDQEAMNLMDENWNFPVSEEFEAGSKLYIQHCLTCHGPEGKGAEDLLPPLAETDWVTGDKGRLIRILLNGLSGEITVNGQKYNQEMPAYDHLSDEELAEILTFIRNNFGNRAGAVIPGEVYEERKNLK